MKVQSPARMIPQGGVEGGRSHGRDLANDTLGTTDGDGDPGGAERMKSPCNITGRCRKVQEGI